MTEPVCPYCGGPALLVEGAQIFSAPRYLRGRKLWSCHKCGAWVRCHGKSTKPLGPLANDALRSAQKMLDDKRMRPLWITADKDPTYQPEDDIARERIRLSARARVEGFLAMRLEFDKRSAKPVNLDLEKCRAAWVALSGVTYADIRMWWYRSGRNRPKPSKRKPKMGDTNERPST